MAHAPNRYHDSHQESCENHEPMPMPSHCPWDDPSSGPGLARLAPCEAHAEAARLWERELAHLLVPRRLRPRRPQPPTADSCAFSTCQCFQYFWRGFGPPVVHFLATPLLRKSLRVLPQLGIVLVCDAETKCSLLDINRRKSSASQSLAREVVRIEDAKITLTEFVADAAVSWRPCVRPDAAPTVARITT